MVANCPWIMTTSKVLGKDYLSHLKILKLRNPGNKEYLQVEIIRICIVILSEQISIILNSKANIPFNLINLLNF